MLQDNLQQICDKMINDTHSFNEKSMLYMCTMFTLLKYLDNISSKTRSLLIFIYEKCTIAYITRKIQDILLATVKKTDILVLTKIKTAYSDIPIEDETIFFKSHFDKHTIDGDISVVNEEAMSEELFHKILATFKNSGTFYLQSNCRY